MRSDPSSTPMVGERHSTFGLPAQRSVCDGWLENSLLMALATRLRTKPSVTSGAGFQVHETATPAQSPSVGFFGRPGRGWLCPDFCSVKRVTMPWMLPAGTPSLAAISRLGTPNSYMTRILVLF